MIGTRCVGAIHLPQPALTDAHGFLQFSPTLPLALPAWFSWDPLLSYFAAAILLVLGVGIVIKQAPRLANSVPQRGMAMRPGNLPLCLGRIFLR
jgi:hypothetical protein